MALCIRTRLSAKAFVLPTILRRHGARRVNDTDRKILVWDIPTRLCHWLTVVLLVVAYVTWRLNWMDWHARAGDALLALLVFRLLWGFFGSETTLFSRFVASPRVAAQHLQHILRREPDRTAGHNPAGGWMVLLLLALLLGEALSGLYVANDVADAGPFTELTPARVANAITALHWILWDALLAAVAAHVAAIVIYAAVKGQNLLTAMVTGRKTLPRAVPQPRMAGLVRACLLFGLSAAAVAVLVDVL